jgi:hypothetical protein
MPPQGSPLAGTVWARANALTCEIVFENTPQADERVQRRILSSR